MSSVDAILLFLLEGEKSFLELNERIPYGANRAGRLVRQGYVERPRQGRYALTERGRTVAENLQRRTA